GGFTVAAASTDAESGVASTSFPGLGSGWSNTGGAYTYAIGATQPGAKTVTTTNGAGLSSATATFTVSADSAAPTSTIACSSGCAGWHTTSPVTITLSSLDNTGG